MVSERLRRSDRLLLSRDYARVARQGTRTATRELVMLVAPARAEGRVDGEDAVRRIGITASRKVGGAVVRNRVKRGVREWFRRSRESLPRDVDVVVIARPGAGALSSQELASRLSGLAGQVQEVPGRG